MAKFALKYDQLKLTMLSWNWVLLFKSAYADFYLAPTGIILGIYIEDNRVIEIKEFKLLEEDDG